MARQVRIRADARARARDALGGMAKHGLSLTDAARQFKVAPSTVRRVGRSERALRKVKGRWAVRSRPGATVRRGRLDADGWHRVSVWGHQDADLLREYARAVRNRDYHKIATFRDKTYRDSRGREHRFITNRTTLARLDRAGELEPPPYSFGATP